MKKPCMLGSGANLHSTEIFQPGMFLKLQQCAVCFIKLFLLTEISALGILRSLLQWIPCSPLPLLLIKTSGNGTFLKSRRCAACFLKQVLLVKTLVIGTFPSCEI